MLRKGIAAAALIAASTSVFAGGPDVPPPAYIGGVYVDVGLSRDDVVDSYRQATTSSASSTFRGITTTQVGPNVAYRVDAGAPGWDGLVGFGYNYVWDNEWSVGLELFGDLSSAHGTQLESNLVNLIEGSNTVYSSQKLRVNRTVGVSLLPGYFVAPGSMYFMELGYVNSEFDLRGYPNPYATSPTINGILSGSPSRELDESGFRIGFGTNTQVGAHVAVRQEYVWETYGNINARRDLTRVTDQQGNIITANFTRSVRVSPDVGKYNLAAVYYFARQGNAPDLNTAPAHVGGHFYVGLNGSYDEDYSHASYLSIRDTTTTNGVISSDGVLSEGGLMKITGWNVGLLAGYGMNFSNRWYAGVEVFGNWDDVDGRYNVNVSDVTIDSAVISATSRNIRSRLEKDWDFGAAFIPGYQVSDNALLYARVGYVGAEFEVNNGWFGNTGFTTVRNAILTRKNERWLSGLQLGVGVDTVVYDNLSLRTEFNINNFGNYNVNTFLGTETDGSDVTATRVSTVHRHNIEDQFNVALIWHFFG